MNLSKLQYHPAIYFLLFGTAMGKMAFFMCMPFIAIHLKQSYDANATTIGIVLGIGPLVGMSCSFFLGYLSDKYGRQFIIMLGAVLFALSFLMFSHAFEVWHFGVINCLVGIGHSAFGPSTNALISDLTPDEDKRKRAFYLRYFLINVGASVGPIIGGVILFRDSMAGFTIASIAYWIYALGFYLLFKIYKTEDRSQLKGKSIPSLKQTAKIVSSDKALLYYLLGMIAMGTCYNQIESTVPQVLESLFSKEGIILFSQLLFANGITVVCSQYFLNRLFSKKPVIISIYSGLALFLIGFIGLAFSLQHGSPYPHIAMVVLTMGEVLVFSNGYLMIDSLAPKHIKGSYFGISSLGFIGVILGPTLGGLLLDFFGSPLAYVYISVIGFASIMFYRIGSHHQKISGSLA